MWSQDGVELTDDIVMAVVTGAVANLGPLTAAIDHLREQLEELRSARNELPAEANIVLTSRLESDVRDVGDRVVKKEEELKDALKHLRDTTMQASRHMARRLASDKNQYAESMRTLDSENPGYLEQVNALAAELHNSGPLDVGTEAHVAADNKLVKVRVERQVSDDEYEVTFWIEVDYKNEQYEAGYDTSERRVSFFKRRDIYSNKKRIKLFRSKICAS